MLSPARAFSTAFTMYSVKPLGHLEQEEGRQAIQVHADCRPDGAESEANQEKPIGGFSAVAIRNCRFADS